MRRCALLITALLLAGHGALRAQRGPDKCGKASFAGYELKMFTGWLSHPLEVVGHSNKVDTLQPIADTATTMVMTDNHACLGVLNAGLKELRATGQMKGFNEAGGFMHRVYRLGPYYAISFSDPLPSKKDVIAGHGTGDLISPEFVLFFDVASLKYLGQVMIPG